MNTNWQKINALSKKIKRLQTGGNTSIVYTPLRRKHEDKTNSNQSNLFLNQSGTTQGYIPQYNRNNYVETVSPSWLQPLSSRLEPEQTLKETTPDFAKAAREMKVGVNVENANYIYERFGDF